MFLPLFGLSSTLGRTASDIKYKDRDRDRHGERERARGRENARERDANENVSSRHRDRDHARERSTDRIRDRPHHRRHSGRHSDSHVGSRSTPATKHAPSKTRTCSPPPASVRVELKSLDSGQHDWAVFVRLDSPIVDLGNVIRKRFEERNRPLESTALFWFFGPNGQELARDDKVTKDVHQIWYRAARFSSHDRWKFSHYQDDTHGRLDSDFTEELIRDIGDGATVKQLRRKIAERWNIQDPNRIVLIAKGGFRPGSIKGDCWEVRRIKEKWLCRWIAIDVCPEKRYIVLKGLRREYVFHPDDRSPRNMEYLKTMMVDKLFRNVRQYGKSHFPLSSGSDDLARITLRKHDGRTVRDREPVVWGAEYTFDLSYPEERKFSDEETWLLAATETCMICLDRKKVSELPVQITSGCKHEPTTCKPCLEQWLQSSMESTTWDRLKCPECPELLKHADVQRYASISTFTRYDELATRAALKDMPNFRWCLSTTCKSGQIDDASCTKFKCKACKTSHCIHHNVPWHKGETCAEYDKRNKKRLKDEKASEETIKKTSKKCPECKKAVHKYEGCNHITCVCGHEWCYICFAKFERNHVGFLFCRHLPTCTERDQFIDLVDNPPADPINPFDPPNRNDDNGRRVEQLWWAREEGFRPHLQHLRAARRPQARGAQVPIPPPPPPPGHFDPLPTLPRRRNAVAGQGGLGAADWGALFDIPVRPREPAAAGGQAAAAAAAAPPPGQAAPLFIGAVNVLTDQINNLANNLQEAVNQQVHNGNNNNNNQANPRVREWVRRNAVGLGAEFFAPWMDPQTQPPRATVWPEGFEADTFEGALPRRR
ncbi:hypothetical protein V8F20_001630 [Naviculisporaceae sp. PSN 640]